jgi:UDP-glucose 4-epimerase
MLAAEPPFCAACLLTRTRGVAVTRRAGIASKARMRHQSEVVLTRYLVAGGAGFIGSHLVRRLLERPRTTVVVYDNFCSGRLWHLDGVATNPRLEVIQADLKDREPLVRALAGVDTVIHLASNPDIAKAARQPDVDFWEGTYLTQNLLEAMRINEVKKILYASGSGVYGDAGSVSVPEDYSPLRPISPYGASKLACEALIGSYCHLFGIKGAAFRFANVVGPRQTHGVTFDFVQRLLREPTRLEILGDGSQSKSYIHISDVVCALLLVAEQGWRGFVTLNVGTEDAVTVREIADLVTRRLGLTSVAYHFAGGRRGWKGDVPVVRLDSTRLRRWGWTNRWTSLGALTDAVDATIAEAGAGRFEHVH